jgi:hypothetical protein
MQNRWILVGTIGRMGEPQVNKWDKPWMLIDLDVPSTHKTVARVNRIVLMVTGDLVEEYRRDFAEGDTVSVSGVARSKKCKGEVRGEYRVTNLTVQKMQLAISANLGFYAGEVVEVGEVQQIGARKQAQCLDVVLSCWTPQSVDKREQAEVQVRIFGEWWSKHWKGRLQKGMVVSCTARMQSYELPSGKSGVMLVVEHMEILRKPSWWEEPKR